DCGAFVKVLIGSFLGAGPVIRGGPGRLAWNDQIALDEMGLANELRFAVARLLRGHVEDVSFLEDAEAATQIGELLAGGVEALHVQFGSCFHFLAIHLQNYYAALAKAFDLGVLIFVGTQTLAGKQRSNKRRRE